MNTTDEKTTCQPEGGNSNDLKLVFTAGGRNWYSRGTASDDGFTVIKGSSCKPVSEGFKKCSYFALRNELEETGVISDCVFTQDFIFRSAGQAGCVLSATCCGASIWASNETDGRGWQEVFPKVRGEKTDYTKPVEAKRQEELVEGLSMMPDGTPRFVETRDGMVYEYRGREAELKARQVRAA